MIELTRRNCMATLGAFCLALATTNVYAQMDAPAAGEKPLSPPAQAAVMLKGKTITIDYSAPSMRGRPIAGALVPYNKVWRTGANAATTLKTPIAPQNWNPRRSSRHLHHLHLSLRERRQAHHQ